MTERVQGAKLCGFLNVLKPPGMSSAQVVGMVRRLLCGEKVGHAGTLDPEAAGVLPLMVGKAARLFDYMQQKEKAYVTEVAFGCATDTQDAQGMPIARGSAYPSPDEVRAVLPAFLGEVWQTPPMYSAIKQDGKRLYQLARDGQQAQVPPRQVVVHQLTYLGETQPHGARLLVRSGKGFYVRTLCQSLGEALGCPAHMRFLLRIQSGVFTLASAHTLEALQAAGEAGELASLLLPVEVALSHMPGVEVPKSLHRAFRTGGMLPWEKFDALHSAQIQEGSPFCLTIQGNTIAIGEKRGQRVVLRTWLGE